MKKLHFTYDMQINYTTEVSNCNFTIKCIPVSTLRQHIENLQITMSPATDYQWGKDGFSNKQIWGKNTDTHTLFRFQIEGDATTGLATYEEGADDSIAMIFAHPHGLAVAGEKIQNFYKEKIKKSDVPIYDKAVEIMQTLFDKYTYQSGTTNVDTSAEEAFELGCGVCQDYAHIFISLLHLSGITARYVTGFIIGEGQSHAWVEVLFNGNWYGLDPTHNRAINDDYIKIAHGRDARDCLINKGIVRGGGLHTQKVSVSVTEY